MLTFHWPQSQSLLHYMRVYCKQSWDVEPGNEATMMSRVGGQNTHEWGWLDEQSLFCHCRNKKIVGRGGGRNKATFLQCQG